MILAEAITYATNHAQFLTFLQDRNINRESAHEILTKITNETATVIEYRIYIDFGNRGDSTNDVRLIVDFVKIDRSFQFIQIDQRSR